MPDPPPGKRTPPRVQPVASPPAGVSYAELHCRTNFSFLEGASHPDELVQQAVELGHAALAITDVNSLAGVVRAHAAAKEVGLKLLIGAEITPEDAPPAVLLATDREAYARLSTLITIGRRRAEKGACRLTFDDVAAHAEGLLAGVLLHHWEGVAEVGATRGSETPVNADPATTGASSASLRPAPATQLASLHLYRDAFGDRCYALAALHHGPDDARKLARLRQLAHAARLPLAATNSVLYHEPRRRFLYDVLRALREGCTVAELGDRIPPNAERCLKSPAQMSELFAACPEAVARTVEVADRCTFSLDELRYEYPRELCPPGTTSMEYLRRLTWEGARRRYPDCVPDKVRQLIEHELALIEELRYEAYFLTVWDLVRFARGRDILCQGRGSAANSAVCYCLGVTSVDPDRIDLLFERFVSKERDEAPDIDIDFEHERREEVIQYVYEKYGRDRAGMTAEVITYRPRSAVRDVGKALGLSLDRVDQLAKSLDHVDSGEHVTARFREVGFDPDSGLGRQLVYLTCELLGFPRHLSQHVGGLVMTERPLHELVPIENASMPERTVIEWDKDDLDQVGMLKVDCLSLGMLTAIRKCLRLIEKSEIRISKSETNPKSEFQMSKTSAMEQRFEYSCFESVSDFEFRASDFKNKTDPLSPVWPSIPVNDLLAAIPPEDPAVYEMIQQADTVGVFQIESRAQMSMLPRLKPECFYDLVIEVAIVRPGPIQGDMVHPYLRRRRGEEDVEFPDDRVREVLEKTMGVPIFQEQAMRLAVVAAGFTPGEADQLRRAMGAWRKRGTLDVFRRKLISGMTANGYSGEFAERVFKQIRGFGEYGFPESHAASFALLVYVSAWLKRYHPAAFTAALINSQPMGFYAPAQLVADARKHGVTVLPVDVNASEWDCALEGEGRAESGERNEQERLPAPGLAPSTAFALAEPVAPFISSSRHSLSPHSASRSLRLGLRLVRGFSESDARRIVDVRAAGAFTSYDDFARRTSFSNAVLTRLARADAFRSLEIDRRAALWRSLSSRESAPLFDATTGDAPERTVTLPEMPPVEQVAADYRTLGLSLKDHPMKFVRDKLDQRHVVSSADLERLPSGRILKVAGLVLLRQRPSTAKGITFVTLEDETGQANLIVRQEIWERYRRAARTATALLATGELQKEGRVIHVLVRRLDDLSEWLAGVPGRSRDFR